MRVRVFFALLWGLSSGEPARAGADWCDQPLQSICEGARVGAAREASYRAYESQAKAAAKERALARFGLGPGNEVPRDLEPKFQRSVALYTQQELAHIAWNWEQEFITQNLPAVRFYLAAAIEAETYAGRLAPSAALRLRNALDEVRYVPSAEVFRLLSENEESREATESLIDRIDSKPRADFPVGAQLAYAIVKMCGREGTTDQAFLTWAGGSSYVTFCPGMLLRDVALATHSEEVFQAMMLIAAHELAHAIGYAGREGLYDRQLVCVQENFWDELYLLPNFKGEKALAYAKAYGHISEITADFWAARALDAYLSGLPSVEKRREAAKRAWSDLCQRDMSFQAHDRGRHPAPTVRFMLSTGGARRSRELLGCGTLPQGGACGLAGLW